MRAPAVADQYKQRSGTAEYTTVTEASQVTEEILAAAEEVYNGWYTNGTKIDWEEFIDRIDGSPLDDGTTLDLGDSPLSPAINKIKQHVQAYAKS